MKKTILLASLALAMLSSCGKTVVDAATGNCDKAGETLNTAIQAWVADPGNKSKCQEYKAALQKVISGCNALSAGTLKQYQDDVNKLKCE